MFLGKIMTLRMWPWMGVLLLAFTMGCGRDLLPHEKFVYQTPPAGPVDTAGGGGNDSAAQYDSSGPAGDTTVMDTVGPGYDTFGSVEDTFVPVADTVGPVGDTTVHTEDTAGPEPDTGADTGDEICTLEIVKQQLSDRCSAADKKEINALKMSDPTLDSTVNNCGLGCVSVGDADDRAFCVTECLLKETKLSCSCGACYGWHFGCVVDQCLTQCVGGPEDPGCITCMDQKCTPELNKCTGL